MNNSILSNKNEELIKINFEFDELKKEHENNNNKYLRELGELKNIIITKKDEISIYNIKLTDL
jgi:hypothetical protein